MAWLQQNEYGQFHVSFRFGGKKYKRSLHTDATKEAQASVGQLEQTLRMVKLGLLAVPDDADVPQFLLSGGRTLHRSADAAPRLTLRQLFTAYFDAMPLWVPSTSMMVPIARFSIVSPGKAAFWLIARLR